jgi:hypothetical protein
MGSACVTSDHGLTEIGRLQTALDRRIEGNIETVFFTAFSKPE